MHLLINSNPLVRSSSLRYNISLPFLSECFAWRPQAPHNIENHNHPILSFPWSSNTVKSILWSTPSPFRVSRPADKTRYSGSFGKAISYKLGAIVKEPSGESSFFVVHQLDGTCSITCFPILMGQRDVIGRGGPSNSLTLSHIGFKDDNQHLELYPEANWWCSSHKRVNKSTSTLNCVDHCILNQPKVQKHPFVLHT